MALNVVLGGGAAAGPPNLDPAAMSPRTAPATAPHPTSSAPRISIRSIPRVAEKDNFFTMTKNGHVDVVMQEYCHKITARSAIRRRRDAFGRFDRRAAETGRT
ncbi:hypothetical protein [Sphingopyxis alaskensis]|uniref:hypothetical protein n=1 Tax=Sphingopyxis alaskensis TaxID=117207 RepID=UPI00059DA7E4|nr:hypothetical protein [Sphingopyxis alaskensis]MCM3418180.1 hypothetical protein [Sphingopyxis alaskensis]